MAISLTAAVAVGDVAGARAPADCAGAPGGGLTLANVAAAGGTLRAVGSNGLVARSRDARRWTVEFTPVRHDLRGVVFTGRRWVVAGDAGTILHLDGRRWRLVRGLPASGLRGVAARPGLVGAAGSGGVLLTSPDGVRWTVATSGTDRILWGGIAVGSSLVFSGQLSTIVTSADGVTWTRVPAHPFRTGNATAARPLLWQLAYDPRAGRLGAVGDFGAILTGSLSRGLRAVRSPTDQILRGLAVARGAGWVAVGSGGVVLSSRDGVRWRAHRSPTTVDLRGVARNRGRWVAVGDQSTAISSADGVHWRVETTAMPCALLGVARGARRLVAVGGAGRVLVSDHRALRWHAVKRPVPADMYAVARGGGRAVAVRRSRVAGWGDALAGRSRTVPHRFVAVGAGGTILRSRDGAHWTAVRRRPTALPLHAVAWTPAGGRWLAGGDRGVLLRSFDGVRWRRVASPAFHSIRGFASAGTTTVAAGAGTIMVQPRPGAGWRLLGAGLGKFQTGVAYGAGRFVVVGHNGTAQTATARDTRRWTPVKTGVEVNLDAVTWTGRHFLATGEGVAIASTDGRRWTRVPTHTLRSLRALAPAGARVVAVGDGGTRVGLPR